MSTPPSHSPDRLSTAAVTDGETTLTVIIPAYNVANFISQCLQSIVAQNAWSDRVSIIVIIDGATDDTERVVREFTAARSEHHITVVTQENKGLSAARNAGLRLVKSPYVTFLDADDFWLPHYLAEIIPILAKNVHDLIEYDALLVNESGRPYRTLRISAGPAASPTRVHKEDFLRVFRAYTWARIYQTALVRTLAFPEGLRFEDTHTTPWYYYHAKSILSLGVPLIGYRQRKGSILNRPTLQDIGALNMAARIAAERYEESADEYWASVAMRAFQQACARVTVLPFRHWPRAVGIARYSLQDCFGPALRGFVRRLQVRRTFLYVVLLYWKRKLDKMREKTRYFIANDAAAAHHWRTGGDLKSHVESSS